MEKLSWHGVELCALRNIAPDETVEGAAKALDADGVKYAFVAKKEGAGLIAGDRLRMIATLGDKSAVLAEITPHLPPLIAFDAAVDPGSLQRLAVIALASMAVGVVVRLPAAHGGVAAGVIATDALSRLAVQPPELSVHGLEAFGPPTSAGWDLYVCRMCRPIYYDSPYAGGAPPCPRGHGPMRRV